MDGDSGKDFTDDFMKVWNAPTSVEFFELWNSCNTKWSTLIPNGEKIIKYLEDTWLPYAESFANCYVSKYLHLGHLTSSKAEGAHHYSKMFISDSARNLFTVIQRIRIALSQQHRRYQDLVHQQQVKGFMKGHFYREVNTSVCRHALKLVKTQVAFLEKHQSRLRTFGIPIPECTCKFRLSLGVPCYHLIKEKLDLNQRLCLADFNRHWYIIPSANFLDLPPNDNSNIEAGEEGGSLADGQVIGLSNLGGNNSRKRIFESVNEPVTKKTARIRLAANLKPNNAVVNDIINSTQRQPSQHESGITVSVEDIISAQLPPTTTQASLGVVSTRAPRNCSGCGQPGHTYRTCGRRRVNVIE